jgi:hypothetical protein
LTQPRFQIALFPTLLCPLASAQTVYPVDDFESGTPSWGYISDLEFSNPDFTSGPVQSIVPNPYGGGQVVLFDQGDGLTGATS